MGLESKSIKNAIEEETSRFALQFNFKLTLFLLIQQLNCEYWNADRFDALQFYVNMNKHSDSNWRENKEIRILISSERFGVTSFYGCVYDAQNEIIEILLLTFYFFVLLPIFLSLFLLFLFFFLSLPLSLSLYLFLERTSTVIQIKIFDCANAKMKEGRQRLKKYSLLRKHFGRHR